MANVQPHIVAALKKKMADRLRAELTQLRMDGMRLGLTPDRRISCRKPQ